MPKLDLQAIPQLVGSRYPAPFDREPALRRRQRLGEAGGLSQFGVNRMELPPGAWSSQRHWHSAEDEFVYVIAGEVMLISDAGEEVLRAGDCATFARGVANGHHLVNRSTQVAVCLEVGARVRDDATVYPDVDLYYDPTIDGFTHRDGTPYPRT